MFERCCNFVYGSFEFSLFFRCSFCELALQIFLPRPISLFFLMSVLEKGQMTPAPLLFVAR